ncbi:uncharacterized protein [Embiotoca jacksoni]|uniref:uncharacterized protein n=1 Tax=Embiotoca jacksoni TaxID=100190 RepID=UPI003703B13A
MPHRIWRLQLACPQTLCTGSLTKAGLYRTIRRVLDIDGWYLMATEYLECRRCKKKVGGWSQGVVRQLAPTYSCRFPAVLAYKLSCDQRVVGQLRRRSLGNGAARLHGALRERHSDAWMRTAIRYLGVCEQFVASRSARAEFQPPPQMPPVPSPVWLLTVYGYDVLTRLDEYKARITSTFGSVLNMDSTKKAGRVYRSSPVPASDTAAWVTSVGNEHGQVLMSVLTCSEGSEGLSRMAAGLTRRYQHAEVPPPQIIYVDRDCCNQDGVSRTAALFPAWGHLVVRLDIWHLMRRFASGVTTESHQLYPTFMRQLSHCIFEVDPGDARRLGEAKRSELEGKHGMVGLTDAEVIERISKKEWSFHCRRRTRGAVETALLVQELLDTFGGAAGRDALDIPLLDALRIQNIWSTQRRHLSCIQDPPGVQLYTETGRLTKGRVSLPVYRCARGSASLESFHLHLHRFIPGTRASPKYFQAFLVDGLVRWNEDRAAAAQPPLLSYSCHLKHVLNQKSQRVLGLQMVEDLTKPAAYTGELIGLEYLYQQTGRVLEDVSLDPDAPDEAAAVDELEEADEGIEEDVEDPTVFQPDTPSAPAAARSGDPSDAPKSEPSSPAAPTNPDVPPEVPDSQAPGPQLSSDSSEGEEKEEVQGPDGQPGHQHVLRLAKALVEARDLQGLSDRRVGQLVALWQRLPERDTQRVACPARHQERQPSGLFKAAKGKNTSCPGKESLQRCPLGLNSGPANWPNASRLVEAVCSQLCRLHPASTWSGGITRSRWSLVLQDYVAVREAVLASPRLMAQTSIQLFELNQRTLSQWFSCRQKTWEKEGCAGAGNRPRPRSDRLGSASPSGKQVGQGQPFTYHVPEEQPGPSSEGPLPAPLLPAPLLPSLLLPAPLLPAPLLPAPLLPSLLLPAPLLPAPLLPSLLLPAPLLPAPLLPAPLLPSLLLPAPLLPAPPLPAPPLPAPPPLPPPLLAAASQAPNLVHQRIPRSTAHRKRKAAEALARGDPTPPGTKARRQPAHYTCSKCGLAKRYDTGHTRIGGVSYCAAVGGKTVEQWRDEMKRAAKDS